jgi:trehalose 6-phosphate phosphatase
MLLFDFDGTLAAIVDDPAEARPRPGVVERLVLLSTRYRRVGVVSGRPVSFLTRHLPASLFLSGLYGMETSDELGATVVDPAFSRYLEPVAAVVAAAREARLSDVALAEMEVEDKVLSVTLHYRSRPGLAQSVEALAHTLAQRHGLTVRAARMSVEVHPPVEADKGSVVQHLVTAEPDVDAVLFVGDDVGDLPAFEALGALSEGGVQTMAIAVESTEIDPRLRRRADLVIREDEVVTLLELLATAPPPA